ncbi:MAG: hypothetical protein KatS3mg105_4764 [Gemmatales bacterium]|nr:MAG: hypothetical protein KatS3mg105_4764 [Gemmatales bacterium]
MPLYFDLSDRGAAADPEARKFVVAQRKELAGGAVPTPPFLLMNADGKVLAAVNAYASPDQIYEAMRKVLRNHPEYDQPSEEEKKLRSPIERAQVQIDLGNYDEARKILKSVDTDEAHYLLGRLARFGRNWQEMEKQFACVKNDAFSNDILMERAYPLWFGKKFAELRDHLKGFPKSSRRYTEARYYEGLAWYHLGKKDKALEIWKSTITGCTQDPWIYRADWAYTTTKDSARGIFTTAGKRTSLLNRIGYMGRRNPDLQGP